MVTFNDLWRQLYEHGSTTTKQQECAQLWDSLTQQQQEQLLSSISNKLKKGRFVHYDPLRAMQENIRQELPPPAEPTNYNGSREFDRMVASGRLCTAEYNGQVGIYTIEDVTTHHMNLIKRLQP